MICRNCSHLIEPSPSKVTAPTGYIHVGTGSSYCEPQLRHLNRHIAEPDPAV